MVTLRTMPRNADTLGSGWPLAKVSPGGMSLEAPAHQFHHRFAPAQWSWCQNA